jgi:chromosome segregation ATPase
MAQPEGLTREELVAELEDQGIDIASLKKRVVEIVRRLKMEWKDRNKLEKKLEEILKKYDDLQEEYFSKNAKAYESSLTEAEEEMQVLREIKQLKQRLKGDN